MAECNKVKHSTKEMANDYANYLFKATRSRHKGTRISKAGKKMRAYSCKHCSGWHLTSAKKVKHQKWDSIRGG